MLLVNIMAISTVDDCSFVHDGLKKGQNIQTPPLGTMNIHIKCLND